MVLYGRQYVTTAKGRYDMDLLNNFPLWAAFSAIFFAQFIKVPIHYLVTKKADWSLLTSTGGMPSSHSAAVTALATAVALDVGLDSTLFAVTAIFAVIVMYDAKGFVDKPENRPPF